jgi:ABC-type transporter Mla subunit MlaD
MRKFWNKRRLFVLGLLLVLLVLWVAVRLLDAGGRQQWRGQNTQYHTTTLPDK